MGCHSSRPARSQKASLNASGSRENPGMGNGDNDHVDGEQMPQKDRDSDSDSDHDEPLQQRLASESTITDQEPVSTETVWVIQVLTSN